MDGRCIHFYSAKVKPARSVFLTGAAPHTCMCKPRGGRWQLGGPGRPVSKPTILTALRSRQYTWAESTRSSVVRTTYWMQGSYCVVTKMVFHLQDTSHGVSK